MLKIIHDNCIVQVFSASDNGNSREGFGIEEKKPIVEVAQKEYKNMSFTVDISGFKNVVVEQNLSIAYYNVTKNL